MIITTKIQVRSHICEFAIGKFGLNFCNPITIPDRFDIYHTMWDLLSVRPADHQVDKGNLEIVIPIRKEKIIEGEKLVGKDPQKFNYLSSRSADALDRRLETMMFAELHELLDENKHRNGIEYQETIHIFVNKYQINSISEDALIKNYYRWRRAIRRIRKTRAYSKQ